MATPRCLVLFRGGTSLRNVLTGLRAMRSQRPIRHPDLAWLLSSLVGMTAVATILDPLHAYVVSDMSPPQNRCSALCPVPKPHPLFLSNNTGTDRENGVPLSTHVPPPPKTAAWTPLCPVPHAEVVLSVSCPRAQAFPHGLHLSVALPIASPQM